MRVVVVAIALCGACAKAGALEEPLVDSGKGRENGGETFVDAKVDARPDAPPDACVPVTTQLLFNPAFDLTPAGVNWTEQLIQSGFPLITAQDGVAEQSAPMKAWLGGFTGNAVTDVLHQDVAIPPNTTTLVLSGFYDVRTAESTTTTVFDTGSLAVTQTNGTPIATVISATNLTPKTAWTPFAHTFTQNLSGQVVRIRMTSTNDVSFTSSFYFDTLALTATHGCP